MIDIRPVAYVIGLLLACLGGTMIIPLIVDLAEQRGQWHVFLESAAITILAGTLIATACANAVKKGLTLQQTFLLTTMVWVALPLFGAIPFMLAGTTSSFTDAYFEAMSGLTTTGSTVLSDLETLPKGILLWRGILQWLGGIGIIVVAMVFLPELRVGGMQIFRSEAFDTMGKILPRATQISSSISSIYVFLTLVCAICYMLTGMGAFDATVHAMTTVATGGFANYDASFGAFSGPAEYVAAVFMILAALPFVRYVQMVGGARWVLFRDSQVLVFVVMVSALTLITALTLINAVPAPAEQAFRQALFNITSIISGTGYASANYMLWGPFMVAMFFFVGLIGGCAGSTACSVKVFRYQLLFASIAVQLRRIRAPHGVFSVRYQGKPVGPDVIGSVMSFFVFFVVSLGVFAVALSLTGEDFITSLSGAAAALGNIGPGLGDKIGPAGNFATLGDTAKWILIFAMVLGRLELLVVFALFTLRFWRA
ncbi:TrkH family potassium uptake protein [Pseudoponticoccus marisrubri]|uniref:Trk system potassium uptake protein n=1 Tax=Pseudoponticoccus marisrubri TaxID=1685382 RepID=A0A0W7WDS3_9RHOB|nr:TrkH family potassium uptake protein [Pseudoponticoccus marisrubri]KUF08687.1 potassium transporter TrkH [Pseudoponticoccus marisrubri]